MTTDALGGTTSVLTWDLPDRLRKSLRVADISVNDMADELGLTRGTVGNYMSGRTHPKRPVLMAWAMRTGVPFEWLSTGVIAAGPDGLPRLDSNQEPPGNSTYGLNLAA